MLWTTELLGSHEQTPRKLERPVAKWVPINVHMQPFTILLAALQPSVMRLSWHENPLLTRLLTTSCFLAGRRSFCEIRAADEMWPAQVFRSRVVIASWCLIFPIIVGRWNTDGPAIKASCYPANTVIVPCAHNGTHRRPTRRFEHICSFRNARDKGYWFRERISRLNSNCSPTLFCLQ